MGFGLHEAMDQTGAVIGPIIISLILYLRGGYSQSFAILLVPAILALCTLALSRRLYPSPRDFEKTTTDVSYKAIPTRVEDNRKFSKIFWPYLAFVSVSVGGYVNFQLISYHFKISSILSDAQIPILFAIAMGIDALVALVAGRLFDKRGLLTHCHSNP